MEFFLIGKQRIWIECLSYFWFWCCYSHVSNSHENSRGVLLWYNVIWLKWLEFVLNVQIPVWSSHRQSVEVRTDWQRQSARPGPATMDRPIDLTRPARHRHKSTDWTMYMFRSARANINWLDQCMVTRTGRLWLLTDKVSCRLISASALP